jgi:hypothetical protein
MIQSSKYTNSNFIQIMVNSLSTSFNSFQNSGFFTMETILLCVIILIPVIICIMSEVEVAQQLGERETQGTKSKEKERPRGRLNLQYAQVQTGTTFFDYSSNNDTTLVRYAGVLYYDSLDPSGQSIRHMGRNIGSVTLHFGRFNLNGQPI